MSERDLYQELADRIMMGHSDRIKRLFAMLADEDEARLLLEMPALPEDLAEVTGRPVKDVNKALDILFKKGLVFVSASTGKYRMCRDTGQFHDATILWPDAPQEFYDLWREFTEEEWGQTAKAIEQFLANPPMRIIPIETALEDKNQILHYENVKEIVENAEKLAVTKCTCRVVDGSCGLPVEVCVQLNRGADYAIKRGTGRAIDKAEAMKIMDTAAEAGLVHVTMNTDHSDHFICNCCYDCCIGLSVIRMKDGAKFVSPSRFKAEIDKEACVGCEECLERCYFNALSINEDDEPKAQVAEENCVGCGLCAYVCPSEAIHFNEAHTPDFIPASKT
ncbi:MAG: 4Fe-4S dicluster-binding protein [Planctomycetota bacterium]|jgi:ferredoxin